MNGVAQIYSRDALGRIASISIQKATEPRYGAPAAVPGEPLHDPVPVDPNIPPVLGVPSILAGLTNLTGTVGAPIPAVGTQISFESYQYDALSRLIDVTRNPSEGLVPRDQFTYDHSGQLNTATYTARNGSSTRSVSYGQDALGNRSQVNDNGNAQSYSPMPNYRNQYATGPAGSVSNGVEHEVAGYQGLSYGYRNDGRLATVSGNGSSYALAYDALGRCVKRTLNGTTIYYTYDGPHPIYEWKADGTRAGLNLYGQGIDEILLRADYQVLSNGQGYFFQQNRLGSVTHLTGFSGETIESYRYDAFGTPTTTNTWGIFNNRFKFTGREYQSAFGIYEYRARAYHPGLGRFLSEDPMGFAAGDANLFRYCGGDPVNRRDPFGLADRFIGVEIDFVPPRIGLGGVWGFGIVIDSNNYMNSGVYGSRGPGGGISVGINVGAGYAARDIEGSSVSADANWKVWSIELAWDKPGFIDGFNAYAFSWGIGYGASVSDMTTSTFTLQDMVNFFRNLFSQVAQSIDSSEPSDSSRKGNGNGGGGGGSEGPSAGAGNAGSPFQGAGPMISIYVSGIINAIPGSNAYNNFVAANPNFRTAPAVPGVANNTSFGGWTHGRLARKEYKKK